MSYKINFEIVDESNDEIILSDSSYIEEGEFGQSRAEDTFFSLIRNFLRQMKMKQDNLESED